ncbi:UNVERIFIED_CONTAM: hypothetical protein FKN15_002681 [Acipenser sinensis]
MQVTSTEVQEGGEEHVRAQEDSALEVEPLPVKQTDQETGPQPITDGPEGGEEPKGAQGSALGGDPLLLEQKDQKTGPQPTAEGPVLVKVTDGMQEEPLKEKPPQASPCAVAEGETATSLEVVPGSAAMAEPGPVTTTERGEEPKRIDPISSRTEDGPETVLRSCKKGPKLRMEPSGSAAYNRGHRRFPRFPQGSLHRPLPLCPLGVGCREYQ